MEGNDDKAIDEEQTSILEKIINSENNLSIKVIVPKDTFNDEVEAEKEVKGISSGTGRQSDTSLDKNPSDTGRQSDTSLAKNPSGKGGQSDSSLVQNQEIQKKYGYSFNVDGFETNSIAYFNELLLGYKSMNNCCHVNFNFNDLLSTNLYTIDICKKMLNPEFEVVGDIDGVIKNVESDKIKKAKESNPYSIFTSKKFFENNKNIYDIFCESTFGLIEKLKQKEKKNRKLIQLKKLIFLINFINEINNKINDESNKNQQDLKSRINNIFHHDQNNKIILCIIVDGNYKHLIEQMKNSNLFAKEWKDNNENKIMKNLYKYFSLLRNSKIPFLIVYCPRFYERNTKYFNPILKLYQEDEKDRDTKLNFLANENAQLKKEMFEQRNLIEELKKRVEELESNNRKKDNFLGNKRKRAGARKKIKKKKGNE